VSAPEDIAAMIAKLRAMGGGALGEEVAPDVARIVEADLRRSIAQGQSPDGEKWQDKRDGGRPLANAAGALGVAAVGGTVYVRLTGPEARHDQGRARGGIVRQVIPHSNRVPDRMALQIREVINAHFEKYLTLGGGNG
jgi:hypothetical protein